MGDAALDELDEPVQFPPEWTLFERNFSASFGFTMEIGLERGHALFALRVHSGWSLFGRPSLVLHSGPTKDGPRIAVVKDASLNPLKDHNFDVVIPPAGSGSLDDDDSRNGTVQVRSTVPEAVGIKRIYRFLVPVGKERTETFEWRHTFGDEVGDLIGGMGAGWKLVRMDSTGGTRSDGHEVVAVWAAGKANLKEAMKFRVINSGVTSELGGETFALAAVMSGLEMWDHQRREAMQRKPS